MNRREGEREIEKGGRREENNDIQIRQPTISLCIFG